MRSAPVAGSMAEDGGWPLRDKGLLTRLMVLRAYARGGPVTLRTIADGLGITVQAVSEHVKRLVADGYLASDNGSNHVTPAGLEFLRSRLEAVKHYVDDAVRDVAHIDATAARAAEPVSAGQAIGLFMEAGELVAYPERDASSRGTAAFDARAGEDVWVTGLSGIVDLEPGQVTIIVLPDAEAGGSRRVDLKAVRGLLPAHWVVVTTGAVAARVAELVDREAVRFGGASAVVDAAVRGVNVAVLVESGGTADFRDAFDRAAASGHLAVEPTMIRLGG